MRPHEAAIADAGPRGRATRQRLVEAAIRLFAERHYAKVTVRDIASAADANLAAVNYHFGDKFGLYRAVLKRAVREMRRASDSTMQPRPGASAEERLRHYIRAHVLLLIHVDPEAWIFRLLLHEMIEPTDAAPWIVEHGFRPRLRYLCGVIAEVVGTDVEDPRVLRCAMSVQAQFQLCRPDKFRAIAFGDIVPRTESEIDMMVEHLTSFSLAGIRAVKAPITPR